MRHTFVRYFLAIVATLLLALHAADQFKSDVAQRFELPFLNNLELMAYDARVRLTMPKTMDERIVIVDIDERSLAQEGRFPWGRDRIALLASNLVDQYQAAVVGFDVVFAEPDTSSGLPVLNALKQRELARVPEFASALAKLAPSLDRDALLAHTLGNKPIVLGYYFTGEGISSRANVSGALPAPVFDDDTMDLASVHALLGTGYGANLPVLQQAAAGAGHFDPVTDSDGVVRRVPMLVRYDKGLYESLALSVVRTYLGHMPLRLLFPQNSDNLEWLLLGKHRIPVDHQVAALVPYRGPQGSFRYISAADVLNKQLASGELAGKIVLVGTTAPGLRDNRATPVANVYAGVEVHANLIAGMLDDTIKQQPAFVLGLEVVVLAIIGLGLGFALPSLNPIRSSLLVLAVLTVLIGANLAAWQFWNFVIPLASPLLLAIFIFGVNMSYGFFVESRARRQITDVFGQYVPPRLVDELSRRPELCNMEGESREMTVLFSDVRNFTRISESMPPKDLAKLMNAYLSAMTEVIQRNGGTIDKYIGDAIMAFWGAPLPDEQHAAHAITAALEMQAAAANLRDLFKAMGWPELHIGVGLNSGTMVVGNMGSRFRRAYTVMGDRVNLASRLEGITKQYGVGIIAGEDTAKDCPDVSFRELDRVRVVGKQEPVSICEPLGPSAEVSEEKRQALVRFESMLQDYRACNWANALELCHQLLAAYPEDSVYRLYQERIEFFMSNPPPAGWDGVFEFKTK